MAGVSVTLGLCLAGYGLWHLVTGRGSHLTPTAVSGAAVIRWYGASWLPLAAYFLAGPWLLRPGGSTRVLLLSVCTVVLTCALLLGGVLAQHR